MPANRSPLAASLAIHIAATVLLFTIVSVPLSQAPIRPRGATFVDVAAYRRALKAPPRDAGGGSGARSLFPVSQGRAPKQSAHPFTPPLILTATKDPVLLMEPALLIAPDIPTANLPQWGDPLANSHVLSNGRGSGGSMGDGRGPGLGPGTGPGYGPGPGGTGASIVSHTGATAPKVIYQIDPEFSEEARRAKHYGTVILVVDVDTRGRPVNIRIAKSLGLGLDEKAVEAVSRWKFQPGRRDGKPVIVPATIEVNFHLL